MHVLVERQVVELRQALVLVLAGLVPESNESSVSCLLSSERVEGRPQAKTHMKCLYAAWASAGRAWTQASVRGVDVNWGSASGSSRQTMSPALMAWLAYSPRLPPTPVFSRTTMPSARTMAQGVWGEGPLHPTFFFFNVTQGGINGSGAD